MPAFAFVPARAGGRRRPGLQGDLHVGRMMLSLSRIFFMSCRGSEREPVQQNSDDQGPL